MPVAAPLTRVETLATLARRYFQSRGPATVADFAWWTGLTLGDAREGLELAGTELRSERIDGETYWLAPVDHRVASHRSPSVQLLPAFDEYLVGYRDRSAVIDPKHARKVNAGGGILNPALVIDGGVEGTWKRTLGKRKVVIAVQPFRKLSGRERSSIAAAGDRYGAFLGLAAQTRF